LRNKGEKEVEHRDEIGFQVRTLSNLIKRLVDQTAFQGRERPATGMHGWVIGYLYENRNRDVFQRDLQEQFSIRRSTVTGILQLMEKNGLITRQSVDEDARLKKIVLTPKAIEQHEQIHRSIRKVEEQLSEGLTPEEKQTFLELCDKIRRNIE
jgi:DNA-binding MarR family transcriptional regulator